jgi:sugar lactone lactonase YvrE
MFHETPPGIRRCFLFRACGSCLNLKHGNLRINMLTKKPPLQMTLLRIAPRFPQALSFKASAVRSFFVRLAALGLGLTTFTLGAHAQDYTYTTFAGIAGKQGNIDGTGGNPLVPIFNFPIGVAVNPAGNVYVTDTGNALIRMVTPAGVVTSFVGTAGKAGGNDGTSTDPNVTFNLPHGPVVDGAGNLYVADYNGATIRKISPTGTVTTLAGTAGSVGSADGTGSAARFRNPSGLALDGAGNVYVADSGNHVIRKITPGGVVTTVAGLAETTGSVNGKGTTARFKNPRGIASDSGGVLYVADTDNNMIRKIAADGEVSTLAGTAGTYGSTDGVKTAARFNFPNSVALDSSGNLYVADEINNTIRKITPDGTVSTLAGLAGSAGRVDGTGSVARFDRPTGVAVDGSGNIYVADYRNHLIRRVSAAGAVTTIAGVGGLAGLQNGTGFMLNPVLFRNPTGAVVDAAGNVYVSDSANNSIKKISPGGSTTLLAGSPTSTAGITNGQGSAARFHTPAGLALDGVGNLYVADSTNQTIRKISPSGDVSTYAGVATVRGSADGDRATATFDYPSGVAVDGAGNVYVADYGNHVIRMISASGNVTTLAGTTGSPGGSDGVGSGARFKYPRDLALDASGNLYVADTGNHAIRKIAPGGLVQTWAGSTGNSGSADGGGSSARFNGPAGVSVDGSGNVYVADANNSTVRKITVAGVVSTVGGTAGSVGTADGVGATARFNYPTDVAVDASGNLFIADNRNHTVRKGSLPGSGGGDGGGGGGGGGGGDGSDGSGGTDDSSVGSGFLLQPVGVTSDSAGNFYVCDTANHCIKKITSAGVVTVLAGKSGSSGSADGTGEAARFNSPIGISIDTLGNICVTDSGNSTIRKITGAGVVTTFAGTAGTSGTADGTGTAAQFSGPSGIAVNTTSGDLYVADSANATIRRITTDAVVTTLAGAARTPGDTDGIGNTARFNNPTGLAYNAGTDLLVADTFNNTVRRVLTSRRVVSVTATGAVTEAGNALVVLTDAGLTGSPVTLNVPVAAADTATAWAAKVVTALAANSAVTARYTPSSSGDIITLRYLTSVDDSNAAALSLDTGTAKGITPTTSTSTAAFGTVSTIVGSAGISGAYDGNGEYALFNLPQALSIDSNSGMVYVADTGNNSIRRISSGATVSTVSGIPGISGKRSGPGAQALFNQPKGILAFSSALVVIDTGNSILRSVLLTPTGSNVSTVVLSNPAPSGGDTGGGGDSGGGGGGGPSLWFIATLAGLGLARWRHRAGKAC